VELIHGAKGELLMKGSLHTDELMRSVTAKSTGLRTARRISHVFVIGVFGQAETLFITDAAINIFPDLDCKRDIVQNAIRSLSPMPLVENAAVPDVAAALTTAGAWLRDDLRKSSCGRTSRLPCPGGSLNRYGRSRGEDRIIGEMIVDGDDSGNRLGCHAYGISFLVGLRISPDVDASIVNGHVNIVRVRPRLPF
jgi:hypothetical protein